MSRKRVSSARVKNSMYELSQALVDNGKAWSDGPRRRNWSRHDIKHIKPLTPTQDEMFKSFFGGNNIFAHGTAGTGKTFISMYLALNEILHPDSESERIIIVRSAVPAREQGFLPGTDVEKMAVYEAPYMDMLEDLFGKRSTYDDMKEAGKIVFTSTSFIRGVTWDNAVIVFDEVQNCSWEEINTVMTRVGENTRIILCGDHKQNDLITRKNDTSGIESLIDVVRRMSSIESITFTRHDIVRSNFVKQWIIACEDIGL